jgi:toxin ParE1/3/4
VIPYSFHPEAEREFVDAVLFYESRIAGLGRQFSAEVQRIITLVREYPDAGAPIRLPVRKTLIDRFPYAIFYRHDRESVHILAVAHLRQRPGYWRRRQ